MYKAINNATPQAYYLRITSNPVEVSFPSPAFTRHSSAGAYFVNSSTTGPLGRSGANSTVSTYPVNVTTTGYLDGTLVTKSQESGSYWSTTSSYSSEIKTILKEYFSKNISTNYPGVIAVTLKVRMTASEYEDNVYGIEFPASSGRIDNSEYSWGNVSFTVSNGTVIDTGYGHNAGSAWYVNILTTSTSTSRTGTFKLFPFEIKSVTLS